MDTINNNVETNQAATTKSRNWMIDLAEILFTLVMFFQVLSVMGEAPIEGFQEFAYHNALPLIAVLAYRGMKKDMGVPQANQEQSPD